MIYGNNSSFSISRVIAPDQVQLHIHKHCVPVSIELKYLPEVDFYTNIQNNRILAVYFTVIEMQNMSSEFLEGFCIFTTIKYAVNGLGNYACLKDNLRLILEHYILQLIHKCVYSHEGR